MAILHVFNPEHDLALAANLSNFTAPHAGRRLRADLGYLPALWAGDNDFVLVENVADAARTFSRVAHRRFGGFVDRLALSRLGDRITAVQPWGWDLALRACLLRQGLSERLMPTTGEIAAIRTFSHREHAMQLLARFRRPGTIGSMAKASTLADVQTFLDDHERIVVKAPWSSSGRGVRFVAGSLDDNQRRWTENIIDRQGCVMLEPYYNKVKDLGMEFACDEAGVRYLGLSLFHTSNGAYTGNVIASDDEKTAMVSRYLSADLLQSIKQDICSLLAETLMGRYRGPFGVDMMIVASDDQQGFLLHPCVEINLRRTMGHVALSVPPFPDGFPRVMSIRYDGNTYKLSIRKRS